MKSALWTVIIFLFLNIAGNYYQYIIAGELRKEVQLKDDKIYEMEERVTVVSDSLGIWKEMAEYLKDNPETRWRVMWKTKTETVTVTLPPEQEEITYKLFEETLSYTGENALIFTGIKSNEGDSLSFTVEENIKVTGALTENGQFMLLDTNKYWLKSMSLIKVNKDIAEIVAPKYYFYPGITLAGNMESKKIDLLVGANITIDNKINIGIFGNTKSLQISAGYNVLNIFGK